MARFYAKFDAGNVTPLDNDFFNKLRIHSGSSSAAPYRDGLIASRSLLSADVYEDLDPINRDGSKGIFFPSDSASTNIPSNFVSWSTAFTSSIEGIKTPVTNAYALTDSINYSKRPTSSVSYSSSLVIPTDPVDPIGISYTTYRSASEAVLATINTIQTTASTNVITTPYTRQGNFPSRTLHSIWHDPTMSYFAWDDFTPGTPVSSDADVYLLIVSPTSSGTPSGGGALSCSVRIEYGKTFLNDFNSDAKMDLIISYSSNNGGGTKIDNFRQMSITGSETPSAVRNKFLYTTPVLDCVNFIAAYSMHITMSYFDPIITSSQGPVLRYVAEDLGNIACGAGTQP